jgi:hypothetical protein
MNENENLLTEALYDQERRLEVKITFAKSDLGGLVATHRICLGPTNRSKDDAIKKILETIQKAGGLLWVDALSDHLPEHIPGAD